MSHTVPVLRPLAQSEIPTMPTIEQAVRERYRSLGGPFVEAANAPTIAEASFATGEAIVAEW